MGAERGQSDEARIGAEIIDAGRTSLCVRMPYFRSLLWSFNLEADDAARPLGTDGQSIFYSPSEMIRIYKSSSSRVEEILLHMTFHCVLYHLLAHSEGRERHIACDTICERLRKHASVPKRLRNDSIEAGVWMHELIAELAKSSPEELGETERENYADDHSYWGRSGRDEIFERSYAMRRALSAALSAAGSARAPDESDEGGDMTDLLTLRRGGRHDYRRYLRQFAFEREEVSIDTESFDYIPYIFGLEHYGNMPLIEHLEYRGIHRLEELVIAIDTSGSCTVDIVRRFLEETYGILSSRENFFKKMNVYVIQCDCEIQHSAHITCEEEWTEYIESLEIFGRGGTDFRPVFEMVEHLRAEQELRALKGLLYFTDGAGTYPERAPEYRAAFILPAGRKRPDKFPAWADELRVDIGG